jgi:hypothetical protein
MSNSQPSFTYFQEFSPMIDDEGLQDTLSNLLNMKHNPKIHWNEFRGLGYSWICAQPSTCQK